MDSEFPSVLFPSFYNNEPPESGLGHCAGSWGSYGQLRPNEAQSFRAQHTAAGEFWSHTEPVPVPLLAPKPVSLWSSKPANPLDFNKHLQNFFMDHPLDAFSPMASVLGETMDFKREPHKKARQMQGSISVWGVNNYMDKLKVINCPVSPWSVRLDAYSRLLSDVVHSVPVELLGSLVHEELSQQSRDALFCEANSGGALELIPLTPSTHHMPLSGCLVYSPNGLDKLHFQQVALDPHAVVCSDEVSSFLLKGPIQQITSTSLCGHSLCVLWIFVKRVPHMFRVRLCSGALSVPLWRLEFDPSTAAPSAAAPPATGLVLCRGPVLHQPQSSCCRRVAGGWGEWSGPSVEAGTRQVRIEDSNLYFNSQSSWRWCEFSAHPRVILYADRTGAELTDIRVQPSNCHTMFRISQAAECRSGERLLLCRYLSTVHSFHHLICTQYSAYIMDERFPCVPMLKCDHMMEAPPVFCQVLSDSEGATKILLGSQRSQEVTLLQYSGGRVEACMSHGPVQALLRPRDSVQRLPTQLPHRTEVAQDRLAHTATGLAVVHLEKSESAERFCVFQLLQTGDVFYQILERDRSAVAPADVSCTRGEEPKHLEPEPRGPAIVLPHLSSHSLSIWKQWLQRLAQSHEANKSKPAHVMVKSSLRVTQSQTADRSVSTCSVPTEDIVPLPEEVQPEEWSDDLSRRLTAAWDSEQGWHTWWSEHLGVNRAEKTEALRRKRRKEKDAKRVSGLSLLAMSGSFTSSISYQSELSDLSDWAWSDTGGVGSQSEDPTTDTQEKSRLSAATAVQAHPLVEIPSTETEKRAQRLQSESPQPSSSGLHRLVESSRNAFSWSQHSSQHLTDISSQHPPRTSSQRPPHISSSQPKKKSRMGF